MEADRLHHNHSNKNPNFLQEVQNKVEAFHKDKNAVTNKIREFAHNPQLIPGKPIKQEFVKFTGNESELMNSFLQTQRDQTDDQPRNTTTGYLENLRQ